MDVVERKHITKENVVFDIIMIRKVIIFFIKQYQRFAPKRIRDSCLFKPTCSEYMILSIEKYGAIKDIRKGIKSFHVVISQMEG